MEKDVKDKLNHLLFKVDDSTGTVRDIEGKIMALEYSWISGEVKDKISGKILGKVGPIGIFEETPNVWKA